ncbi:MAG: RNA methyltransferase [Crocinitomicaceae bacterium]|nr:RNA methyltransferase [Crocinitomicaceae bacterium]
MTVDQKVLEAFYNMITESKQDKYDSIAANRTRYITVVMENLIKDHNASAVLRSCDCFGIQDLHAIEKNIQYEIQRDIAMGAGNWVNLHSHSEGESSSLECLQKLKAQGYTIVSTSPHTEMTLREVPLDKPIALVFGTEVSGISKDVAEFSDHLVRLPMYGFTESFNVSVSAALALSRLRERLEASDYEWRLSEADQVKLKIEWCTKIIREGEDVEREIRRRILEKE